MSKELIERLRADAESTDDIGLCADAANRIEELERKVASRDAEVAKLKDDNEYLYIATIERDQLREQVKMLRDVLQFLSFGYEAADRIEQLEAKCEELREQVTMLRDTVLSAKAMIAHPDNIAILDKALAATGKDFEGLVVCHAKPLAWARYPRFTGVAQTTPVVVFKKPDGKDWTPLFATTEQKP